MYCCDIKCAFVGLIKTNMFFFVLLTVHPGITLGK